MSRSLQPRHEQAAIHAALIAKVERIINGTPEREQPADRGPKRTRNLEGDARVMRLIPICAEGVPGTEPGTDPLAEYLLKEARLSRRSAA